MSEAKAHEQIEFEAWGISYPDLGDSDRASVTFDSLDDSQKAALEIYSGNWMRDYSQAFVPLVLGELAGLPQKVGHPTDTAVIGPDGAEMLLVGALRTLAMLEFDSVITDALITKESIGQYLPEEHLDNPAGLPFSDLLVRGADGKYDVAKERDAQGAYLPVTAERQQQIDTQLAATAFPGHQVENAALHQLGPLRINYFVYSTVQWVKAKLDAARAQTDIRRKRMLLGTALHGIEDYFAHSNFIEIALNFVIDNPARFAVPPGVTAPGTGIQKRADDPHGRWIDTLYDQDIVRSPVAAPPDVLVARQKRYPVTTGTFGGTDTQVSIAHLLLPKIDAFSELIDKTSGIVAHMSLELYLGNYPPNTDPTERDRLDRLRQQLRAGGAASPRQARAMLQLINALDECGLQLPSLVPATFTIPTRPEIEQALPVPGLGPLLDQLDPRFFGARVPSQTPGWAKPSDAFRVYASFRPFFAHVANGLGEVKRFLDGISALVQPLKPHLPQTVRDFVDYVDAYISGSVHGYDQTLSDHLRRTTYRLLELMIGADNVTDTDRDDPEAWAGKLKDHTHQQESATFGSSDDHRLAGNPPSHSEICKDHPPHPATPGHTSHPMDDGSPFFGLHMALAKSAIQHVTLEFEASDEVVTQGGGQPGQPLLSDAARARRNGEADAMRRRVVTEAQLIGRALEADAQADTLMKAIDLYMAHPEDSSWWHDIVMTELRNATADIVRDANRRNQTRSQRTS